MDILMNFLKNMAQFSQFFSSKAFSQLQVENLRSPMKFPQLVSTYFLCLIFRRFGNLLNLRIKILFQIKLANLCGFATHLEKIRSPH